VTRAWTVEFLAPLLLVAVAAGGVVALGRQAALELHDREEFSLAVNDVECDGPPGFARDEFLQEVQYEARLGDRLSALDPATLRHLRGAFAAHPCVEAVGRVEIVGGGRARVGLRFRTPVLVVETADGPRVLDRNAVLLPRWVGTAGLPVFRGKVGVPAKPAGSVWDEPRVRQAADLAAFLRPHQAELGVEAVEAAGDGWTLNRGGLRVLWGRLPGEEAPTEAGAVLKRDRLLSIQGGPAGGPSLIDLRPAGGATCGPLAREKP
jgi:hypothetical protein